MLRSQRHLTTNTLLHWTKQSLPYCLWSLFLLLIALIFLYGTLPVWRDISVEILRAHGLLNATENESRPHARPHVHRWL